MDSKICRSIALDVEPIMRKSSKVTQTPHESPNHRMRTDKIEPFRKLLPACSATLVCRVRVVDPTYSDAHRAQLNLYKREAHIALGSLSLYEKYEPTLKLLSSTMLKSTFLKYVESKNKSLVFNFSDCCPKCGIEKKRFSFSLSEREFR